MSHTPGPWVAIPSKVRFSDRIGNQSRPLFDDGLWHILPESNLEQLPICTVDRGDDHHAPTRQKAECYARLIAAAPELLEALKGILARYVQLAGSGDCGFWNPEDEDWVKASRCAIAKAEGRS